MCWINNIIGTQSVRFNSYVAGGLVGQNLGTIVFSEDGFTVKSTIKTPVANFNSTTVGGWTLERFGTFPKPGDSFRYENLTVTVLTMDGRRVERVLVRPDPPEDRDE